MRLWPYHIEGVNFLSAGIANKQRTTIWSNAGPGSYPAEGAAQAIELKLEVNVPFRFVAYGDTRFTDPNNTEASKAAVRRTLVQAIADVHPSFISIGGDIAYNGYDVNDWATWDSETRVWRESKIPINPRRATTIFMVTRTLHWLTISSVFPN